MRQYTIASLIEAETSQEDERNMVSEVIWNRIYQGMPLGIDASVIYGIKNYNGNITRADLSDSTNPYNLRLRKGLPPTPINSPTTDSLKAVLSPTEFGYLFYVVDPEQVNRHTFSKTITDHNAAVSKLLKNR